MASVKFYETPLGFAFHPTATELLQYLDHYIMFQSTWSWIAVKELYGPNAAPGDVFSGDLDDSSPYWVSKKERGASMVKTAYVLTTLRKATPTSQRYIRRAGSGTWVGQKADPIRDDSGKAVGRTSSYKYKYDSKNGDRTEWSMREYSLNNPNTNNIVICKITKKSGVGRAQPPPTIDPIVTQQQTPSPIVDPILPSNELMDYLQNLEALLNEEG